MTCPVCGKETFQMLLSHPPQYQCGCGHRWGPLFDLLEPTPPYRRTYRQ